MTPRNPSLKTYSKRVRGISKTTANKRQRTAIESSQASTSPSASPSRALSRLRRDCSLEQAAATTRHTSPIREKRVELSPKALLSSEKVKQKDSCDDSRVWPVKSDRLALSEVGLELQQRPNRGTSGNELLGRRRISPLPDNNDHGNSHYLLSDTHLPISARRASSVQTSKAPLDKASCGSPHMARPPSKEITRPTADDTLEESLLPRLSPPTSSRQRVSLNHGSRRSITPAQTDQASKRVPRLKTGSVGSPTSRTAGRILIHSKSSKVSLKAEGRRSEGSLTDEQQLASKIGKTASIRSFFKPIAPLLLPLSPTSAVRSSSPAKESSTPPSSPPHTTPSISPGLRVPLRKNKRRLSSKPILQPLDATEDPVDVYEIKRMSSVMAEKVMDEQEAEADAGRLTRERSLGNVFTGDSSTANNSTGNGQSGSNLNDNGPKNSRARKADSSMVQTRLNVLQIDTTNSQIPKECPDCRMPLVHGDFGNAHKAHHQRYLQGLAACGDDVEKIDAYHRRYNALSEDSRWRSDQY